MQTHVKTLVSRLMALILIGYSYNAHSQCQAEFSIDNQGLMYTFKDLSTVSNTDSILSRSWDLGDGTTDTTAQVSHFYTFPDPQMVTLTIMTRDSCESSITKEVRPCSINIDVIANENCINGFTEILIFISDNYGVVDSVDIYLDDNLVNLGRQNLGETLFINEKVPGDDELHTVRVESPYSSECTREFFFIAGDCEEACSFTNVRSRTHTLHEVEVQSLDFFPQNKIITLGDTVNFVWTGPANSTTSDTTSGPDSWDSGVQFVGASYRVVPTTTGAKPYYSSTRGGPGGEGMAGVIFVNCPTNLEKEVLITFDHTAILPDGFSISLDGVLYTDSVYQYDPSGTTSFTLPIAADGIDHEIGIIDNTYPACQESITVNVTDCGGDMDCRLNLYTTPAERCNGNGEVEVEVTVSGIGQSEFGISLLLDGAFTLDTLDIVSGRDTTVYISLPGDGNTHRILARDLGNSGCQVQSNFVLKDCTDPCIFSDLSISPISTGPTDAYIGRDGLANTIVYTSEGSGVLFHMETNNGYGIRSVDGLQWDSGIRNRNSFFITPVLSAGIQAIEIYDEDDTVIQEADIEVLKACDNGSIPIFYSFQDENGTLDGYTLFVDDEVTELGAIAFSNGNTNQGAFELLGDDTTHTLRLVHNTGTGCQVFDNFFAPSCDEFDCKIQLAVSPQDTCFNDNTKPIAIEVINPTPLPKGFALYIDGESVSSSAIPYQGDSISIVADTLLFDGSSYTIVVQDLLNNSCTDTLVYTTDTCVTDCSLTNYTLNVVDSSYAALHPSIPSLFVGCQPDSSIFVEIKFDEKYTDANSYVIMIDGNQFNSVPYLPGDTTNTVYVPVKGDSLMHSITIIDLVDPDCRVTDSIRTTKCFKECKYAIEEVVTGDCTMEGFPLSLIMNRNTMTSDIALYIDDQPTLFIASGDTITAELSGDGLDHSIIIQEVDNELCTDTISSLFPYCLDCSIDVVLVQQDSCDGDDLLLYSIDISGSAEDSLALYIDGVFSKQVYKAGSNFTPLTSSGKEYNLEFISNTDQFCAFDTLITTEDCSPVICIADFSVDIDEFTGVFTDNSITSEPITGQSWSLAGGIEVFDVETFTFIFPEAGTYLLCHTIVTDSCSNTVCADIVINPCNELESFFQADLEGDTYTFNNLSSGSYTSLTYDFGDGVTSTEENPTHIYATSGQYDVCLTITNDDLECSDTYCESLDFVSSVIDPVDADIKIYPNPLDEQNVLHIESSIPIDGYAIYSLDGKLLQSADVFNRVEKISLRVQNEGLSDGLLLLHLKTKKGKFVRRILTGL